MSDQTVPPTREDSAPPSWRSILTDEARDHGADALAAVVGGAALGFAFTVESDALAYTLAAIAAACGLVLAARNTGGEGQ